MNSIQNKIYHEWFLRPDKLCVSVSHRGRPGGCSQGSGNAPRLFEFSQGF